MVRLTFTILTLFFASSLTAQQTVRLKVDNLPPEPKSIDLYIAGSFNGWNPADEKFMFQRMGNGQFYIDLTLSAGTYEYKITRGSWKEVECKKGGIPASNRQLTITEDAVLSVSIEEWQDNIKTIARPATASRQVQIITTSFYIPQLKRTRRVWIYLPENYSTSATRYPVLYMHDGQNIFEDTSSYAGEWGIDEFMDSTTAKKCIVVGIDNGTDKRLNEYSPYDFELRGIAANYKTNKGEGALYTDFLVKTLKPFIDKKYRTLRDKSNTFIAGSSMGGLISLYVVLKYPKVFGAAGVFSPAFWISGQYIYTDIKKKGKSVNSKIYFYGGKLEGDSMISDMLKAFYGMNSVSKSKMTSVIRDDGMHNEATWRKEFPLFYQWIMK